MKSQKDKRRISKLMLQRTIRVRQLHSASDLSVEGLDGGVRERTTEYSEYTEITLIV